MPASFMTVDVLPATETPIFLADMSPRVVLTPVTLSPSLINPVTSQCSMMSTPYWSAPRAYPHATASWRAVPPRGWHNPPTMGKRVFCPVYSPGILRLISCVSSSSASTPSSSMALPRLAKASICPGVCARLMTPRWENIML